MNETNPPPASRVAPAASPALLLQRPWTKREVRDYLGVCERTLDRLIEEGGCPRPIRLGGLAVLRWHGPAVIAWWDQQVAEATSNASASTPATAARPVRTGAGHPLGVVTRGRPKARP